MPKLHELTGKILSKDTHKVYKKGEFYRNTNYKLKVFAEETKQSEIILVYANLVNKQFLEILTHNQYLDKRYFFTCQRKKNGFILQDYQELLSNRSSFNKSRQLENQPTK